jgi:hypothetical protein
MKSNCDVVIGETVPDCFERIRAVASRRDGADVGGGVLFAQTLDGALTFRREIGRKRRGQPAGEGFANAVSISHSISQTEKPGRVRARDRFLRIGRIGAEYRRKRRTSQAKNLICLTLKSY